jgi:hypothetical protein
MPMIALKNLQLRLCSKIVILFFICSKLEWMVVSSAAIYPVMSYINSD